MKAFDLVTVVAAAVTLAFVVSFLLSFPVYLLWNGCLVGAIDGVREIGWMQAWGISILCGFLFKPNTSSSK